MPSKTLLILANSVKKDPGRCVAGREVLAAEQNTFGPWIRPVSPDGESEEGELIPRLHCTMVQGGSPQVLDVVEVPLRGQRADAGQPENWEVDSGAPWRKVKSMSHDTLAPLVENPADLWLEENQRIDRISTDAQLARVNSPSLVLIRPRGFHVRMWKEYNPFKGYDQHKTRGVFTHRGAEYSFSITDDVFTRKHCPRPDGGNHDFAPAFGDDCLLCVSLGAPFGGYHYKLIATVIPLR